MKKLIVMLAAAIAAGMPLMADEWYDEATGYTWKYRINGDTAEIYGEFDRDAWEAAYSAWLASGGGADSIEHYYIDKRHYIYPAISRKPAGAVTIPQTLGGKPVTSIGDYAFGACDGFVSGVTPIGDSAVNGCTIGLTGVTIPNSVTNIGNYAFFGCSPLTSVTIPDGVTSIGIGAFEGCSGLTLVLAPYSLNGHIPDSAFSGCAADLQIVYYDDLSYIGIGAFEPNVTNAVLAVSNRLSASYADYDYDAYVIRTNDLWSAYIGKWEDISFSNKLATVYWPLWHIVTNVIYRISVLDGTTNTVAEPSLGWESVNLVAETNATYGAWVLATNDMYVANTNLEAKLAALDAAYYEYVIDPTPLNLSRFEAANVAYLKAENDVSVATTNLEQCVENRDTAVSAVNDFIAMKDIAELSAKIKECEDALAELINKVSALTWADFNSMIAQISERLNELRCQIAAVRAVMNQFASHGIVSSVTEEGYPVPPFSQDACDVYCRNHRYYNYSDNGDGTVTITGVSPTPVGELVIPSQINGKSVTSIGEQAFLACSGLTSVTIPNSVTNIGDSAFSGCSGLTSVTIPNSVTSIGSSAFSGCSGLTRVYITDLAKWCSISFSGSDANPLCYAHNLYLNGVKVTDMVIPSSVTCIGQNAFYGCSGLTSVTIPDSVTSIGGAAFCNCSGLTSVTIPDSVTSIPSSAFDGCGKLWGRIFTNASYGGLLDGGSSYALTDTAADRAIASVTVDGDCAIDSFVLKDGKVYDSVLYISNTADHAVTLSLPSGYVYKAIKGARPLDIPANSQSILSVTRVANNVFLVSREDLETIQ